MKPPGVVLVFLCCIGVPVTAQQLPKISICDLPVSLARNINNVVALRGMIEVSRERFADGFLIEELIKSDCYDKPKRRGFTVRVKLLAPEEEFLEAPPNSYRFSEESLTQIEQFLKMNTPGKDSSRTGDGRGLSSSSNSSCPGSEIRTSIRS